MAHVEVRVQGKEPEVIKLDRVPVAGDFIMGRSGVLLVIEAALIAGGMVEGVVRADPQAQNKFA